ncbi:MAG TPA: ribonuclease HII [Ignavibacteriaceae bacterium]|jgi:ribonuclease HII|nr:ribonuclease HII [Ignavibacteriaceae bacterium]
MRKFDNSFRIGNIELIAGADEVGRGPLAGPVVAASVIFPADVMIRGIRDSKVLTEVEREKLLPRILERSLACSVAVISHAQIDKINILQASLLAMYNSLIRLKIQPQLVLVDGNKGFDYPVPIIPVIKGDAKSFTIAAASIVAKVARDRIMKRLCPRFPQYLWSKNKGYATPEHIEAIKIYGASPLHRKTFLRRILEEGLEPELEFEMEQPLE